MVVKVEAIFLCNFLSMPVCNIVHVYITSSVFVCALCCFKDHVSAKKCLHNTFPGIYALM